jgi:hypothetical protein
MLVVVFCGATEIAMLQRNAEPAHDYAQLKPCVLHTASTNLVRIGVLLVLSQTLEALPSLLFSFPLSPSPFPLSPSSFSPLGSPVDLTIGPQPAPFRSRPGLLDYAGLSFKYLKLR